MLPLLREPKHIKCVPCQKITWAKNVCFDFAAATNNNIKIPRLSWYLSISTLKIRNTFHSSFTSNLTRCSRSFCLKWLIRAYGIHSAIFQNYWNRHHNREPQRMARDVVIKIITCICLLALEQKKRKEKILHLNVAVSVIVTKLCRCWKSEIMMRI